MPTGTELLNRVVDARGVLLRADLIADSKAGVAGIVLTFDVGRIRLSADPAAPMGVAIGALETGDTLPAGCEDAGEEEPWWRLLGAPLTRTRIDAAGSGTDSDSGSKLRLQFRADADNPRTLGICTRDGALEVRLENTAH